MAWQRRPGGPLLFLPQPFDAHRLLAAVDRLLGRPAVP
jgi:hypothetical protein